MNNVIEKLTKLNTFAITN